MVNGEWNKTTTDVIVIRRMIVCPFCPFRCCWLSLCHICDNNWTSPSFKQQQHIELIHYCYHFNIFSIQLNICLSTYPSFLFSISLLFHVHFLLVPANMWFIIKFSTSLRKKKSLYDNAIYLQLYCEWRDIKNERHREKKSLFHFSWYDDTDLLSDFVSEQFLVQQN